MQLISTWRSWPHSDTLLAPIVQNTGLPVGAAALTAANRWHVRMMFDS
jgi:hypothetical protein